MDITNTSKVESPDGNVVFNEGFILRKVSKFVVGGTEDAMMPIPVFYDLESKKIIVDSLPKELREEYEDISL